MSDHEEKKAMKPEDQVCSLGLAKRLKELGVKQKSLFYWHNTDTPYPAIVFNDYRAERSGDLLISAFTVAELGILLQWEKSSEADIRARVLVCLVENGIINSCPSEKYG